MRKLSLDALARDQMERAGGGAGRSATTVYGGHEHVLRQTLVALTADTKTDEHESPEEATVHVLRGRIRVVAGGDFWEGRKGDMIILPEDRHSVEALEDSVFLLTVAKLSPVT